MTWLLPLLLSAALAAEPEAAVPEKRVRWLAAPIFSYDTNLGLGAGGFGQVVFQALQPGDTRPYAGRVAAQLYWTTGGYRSHYLQADLPGFPGRGWRFDADLSWTAWSQAGWYGEGNDVPLLPPGDRPGPDQGLRYYWYDLRSGSAVTNLRRALPEPLDAWAAYAGAWVRWDVVSAFDESLLQADPPDVGADGGLTVLAQGGFLRDTRDDELDPRSGASQEVAVRVTGPWLGSDFAFGGAYLADRRYWSPARRWVLALGSLADTTWGAPPFYLTATTGGLKPVALGGRWTWRGFAEERFHGDGAFVVQPEVRFTALEHRMFKKPALWLVAPFADVGRVWLWEGNPDPWWDVHVSAGAGVRLVLTGLIVLRADVGVAWEEFVGGSRPQVQLYLLSEHPF